MVFPKWSCVLRKCKDCGPLVNHETETDVSEGAPIIQFNTYMKQGYSSIHNVVTTRRNTSHIYDTTTETDMVTGKNNLRKKLFKWEKKIC